MDYLTLKAHEHSPRLSQRYEQFSELMGLPEILVKGRDPQAAFQRPALGIVGSRKASFYGLNFTRRLVAEIARQKLPWTILSGGAYGIDIEAHIEALKQKLPTQAWLVGPLAKPSPRAHESVFAAMSSRDH